MMDQEQCERRCGRLASPNYRTCCRACGLGTGRHDQRCTGPASDARGRGRRTSGLVRGARDIVQELVDKSSVSAHELAHALSRCHATHVDPRLLSQVAPHAVFAACVALEPEPNIARLRAGVEASVDIPAHDCTVLLSKGFFGLSSRCNMRRWFEEDQLEKLKCLAVYFEAVKERTERRHVTIERKIATAPYFDDAQRGKPLLRMALYMDGGIEDMPAAHKTLQADFANRQLGGGVLGRGLVQEEILFVCCPELIAAAAACDAMDDDEAIELRGFERFARHKGYGRGGFKCVGRYGDRHAKSNRAVALDAIDWSRRDPHDQYHPSSIERELGKCAAALKPAATDTEKSRPFATGNWGCGAFRGDPALKGLIQWAVAAACDRQLAFFAFGDTSARDLNRLADDLVEHRVTVGALVDCLFALPNDPQRHGGVLNVVRDRLVGAARVVGAPVVRPPPPPPPLQQRAYETVPAVQEAVPVQAAPAQAAPVQAAPVQAVPVQDIVVTAAPPRNNNNNSRSPQRRKWF